MISASTQPAESFPSYPGSSEDIYYNESYWNEKSPHYIPTLALIYWVIFFLYFIYLLITLFIFIRCSSNYKLQKRGVTVCVLASILNCLICCVIFLYDANYHFPLLPIIWVYHFFVPAFVLITWIYRGLLIIQKFHDNRIKLLSLRKNTIEKLALDRAFYGATNEYPLPSPDLKISFLQSGRISALKDPKEPFSSPIWNENISQLLNISPSSTGSVPSFTTSLDSDMKSCNSQMQFSKLTVYNNEFDPLTIDPCPCSYCSWRSYFSKCSLSRPFIYCFSVLKKLIISFSELKYIYRLKNGPICTVIILLVFQFLLSLLVHFHYSKYLNFFTLEVMNEFLGVSLISIMIYIFIFSPLVLFHLNKITDAFGIKNEIVSSYAICGPVFCILLLWKNIQYFAVFRKYFPSSFFILFSCFIIHSKMITYPLISVLFDDHSYHQYHHRRFHAGSIPSEKREHEGDATHSINIPNAGKILSLNSLNNFNSVQNIKSMKKLKLPCGPSQPELDQLTIDHVFADSLLLAKFRKFTVTEFAVENLLFYEICHEYKQIFTKTPTSFHDCSLESCQHSDQSSSVGSHHELFHEPAFQIYAKFIKSGAIYEININWRTKIKIEERISRCQIDGTLFDEALNEVSQLLISWSLPRFLETLNESIDTSFSRTPF